MKKLSLYFSLIFILIITLSCTACKGSHIFTFNNFYTVGRVETHDKAMSTDTAKKLSDLFFQIEKEFNKEIDGSITYKLNNAGANENIALTQMQKEVLALSKEYYDYSQTFNPAVYPLVDLWSFENFNFVVDFVKPQDSQIQEILDKDLTDYSKVVLEDNYAYKTDAQIKIDLGGLVKGYAVDKALEIMIEAGHESGYINVGNSSMALLNVESLNVTHPRKKGQTLLTVNTKDLVNATLSTSGDYERYFEYQGKRYSHIIDPRTGYPIETGVASATVIGATGTFTDAITTSLCTLNHNPSDLVNSELVSMMKKILQSYPNAQIYVVYEKDGVKQLLTNKKQGDFTLLDTEYSVVNI